VVLAFPAVLLLRRPLPTLWLLRGAFALRSSFLVARLRCPRLRRRCSLLGLMTLLLG